MGFYSMLKYRPDIDGLRALAVLPVIEDILARQKADASTTVSGTVQ